MAAKNKIGILTPAMYILHETLDDNYSGLITVIKGGGGVGQRKKLQSSQLTLIKSTL